MFEVAKNGLRMAVRLQPKAGANCIDGVGRTAEGGEMLRVRVTAVPEKGKANQELLKLLAKSWGLAASRLTIVAGAHSRNKVVLVRDGDRTLLSRLTEWRRQLS